MVSRLFLRGEFRLVVLRRNHHALKFEKVSGLNKNTESQSTDLQKTPLHSWHANHGGRMVDFAGWEMPVQYGSIMNEHHQTRKSVGMFDVSHMGRIWFHGDNEVIGRWLDGLTSRRVAGVEPGKIRYSLMCNESGGILDDVLVYFLPGHNEGEPFWMMVCNASNRAKIVGWLQQNIGDHDIKLEDRTEATAMIAVQGPAANKIVAAMATSDPDALPYYTGTTCEFGNSIILTRTGYTGEDGCEIICEAVDAEDIWSAILAEAVKLDGTAAGLASRDTLRLEAGMPLYGHELTEDINAAQTDLRFAMQLKNRDFVGKAAIVAAMKDESLPVRVGLLLDGKRAAREGCRVSLDGQDVGEVVSGTFGPTVQRSISMAYVLLAAAEIGTQVDVDIRGKKHVATVAELPFYKRS